MKAVVLMFCCGMMSFSVWAGSVYKCKDAQGNVTLSDTECPDNPERVLNLPKQQPFISASRPIEKPISTREATTEEVDRCLRLIKVAKRFKDQESVRVEGVPLMGMYSLGRQKLFIDVNAKNSYGAYAGAKIHTCTYNQKGELEDIY